MRTCCQCQNKATKLLRKCYVRVNRRTEVSVKQANRLVEFCRYNPDKISALIEAMQRELWRGVQTERFSASLELVQIFVEQLSQKISTDTWDIILEMAHCLPASAGETAFCVVRHAVTAPLQEQRIVDRGVWVMLERLLLLPEASRQASVHQYTFLQGLKLSPGVSELFLQHVYILSLMNPGVYQRLFTTQAELLLQAFQYQQLTTILTTLDLLNKHVLALGPLQQQSFVSAMTSRASKQTGEKTLVVAAEDSVSFEIPVSEQDQQAARDILQGFLHNIQSYSKTRSGSPSQTSPTPVAPYMEKLTQEIQREFEGLKATLFPAQTTLALFDYICAYQSHVLEDNICQYLKQQIQTSKQPLCFTNLIHKIETAARNARIEDVARTLFQTQNGVDFALLLVKRVIIFQTEDSERLRLLTVRFCETALQGAQEQRRKSKLFNLVSGFLQNQGQNARDDFRAFLAQFTAARQQPEPWEQRFWMLVAKAAGNAVPENTSDLVVFYLSIGTLFGVTFPLDGAEIVRQRLQTLKFQRQSSPGLAAAQLNKPESSEPGKYVEESRPESATSYKIIEAQRAAEQLKPCETLQEFLDLDFPAIQQMAKELSQTKSPDDQGLSDAWVAWLENVFGQA